MCKKKDIDEYKMIAQIMYTSVQCGSPADSDKMLNSQKKAWRKFINNLDWDTLVKKSKRKPDPVKAFQSLVPGFEPGKKSIIPRVKEIK